MRNSLIFATLLALPATASAQVVIYEIMYDLPGSDSKAEWVELYNTGTEAIDISKWKLNDGSNHVFNAPPKNGSTGSLTIQPGEYLILASDASTFLSTHTVSVSVIDTVMSLSNEKGSVSLLDDTGKSVDKASFSASKGADGTGESLQEIDGKFVHAKPTPGALNTLETIPKVTEAPAKPKATKKIVIATPKPEILDGLQL